MNRLIKFRAFYKPHNKMYYEIGDGSEETGGINKIISSYQNDENWALMQSIGKQDVHKNEIYVGDIVKTYWQHDGVNNYDYDVIGEVKFVEDYLQFMIVVDKGSQITYHPFHSFEREELDEDSIEILGNVYENKHILEAHSD